MIALTVELACAGKLEPGLEVFDNPAVQQSALEVVAVVGFGGFGACSSLRRLRA